MKLTVKKQVQQEFEMEIQLPAYFRDKSGYVSMINENESIVEVGKTLIIHRQKAIDTEIGNAVSGTPISADEFYASLSNTLTAIGAGADRLVSVSTFPEPADIAY